MKYLQSFKNKIKNRFKNNFDKPDKVNSDDILESRFNLGDSVIFIKDIYDSVHSGYNIGDLCCITDVDDYNNSFPYEIRNITNSDTDNLWVQEEQIRLANGFEVSQNKYIL